MDNRRPTLTDNSPRPANRTNNFRNEGDRSYDNRRFQPRDNNRFQPRDNRYQNRDDRGPQNRDDRNMNHDNRPRGGGDGRYQGGGENRFQGSGDNRFQGRDNRNQPRGDGKFQPRNNNKFQPRGRFAPKGRGFKPWEQDRRPRIVSEMQVTDGKHRGKYLQFAATEKVRPTARRIREVMFRILYRRIRAGRFLDLCAGVGTVGIEAISRGAIIGTFVERSGKMCGLIKKNLASCGIKDGHGEIHEIEAVPFLKRMGKRRRFWDVVFFDPPYDSNYEEVLAYLNRGVAIRPHGGVLVIEHHVEMFFPEDIGVLKRWRVVTQGETTLSFYERP